MESDWKGVDEYRDPVDPNQLSSHYAQVFPGVAELFGERTDDVTFLNDSTSEMVDELDPATMLRFASLEGRMEELLAAYSKVAPHAADTQRGTKREGEQTQRERTADQLDRPRKKPRQAEVQEVNQDAYRGGPSELPLGSCAVEPEQLAGDRTSTSDPSTDEVAGAIRLDRKVYRTPVRSRWVTPELGEDENDGLDYIFGEHGKAVRQEKQRLPDRNDVVEFNVTTNSAELERNLKLNGCPSELQPEVTKVVKEYWDVFSEGGLSKPIRGFTFQIDTGSVEPVCCKPPRYGHHESEVMRKLAQQLRDHNVVEEDHGPWGAMVVLAAKPHQEGVHWRDYQWRLCVSFRKLNAVTKPFTFPIPRCDDAVNDVDPKAQYFIAIDMDSGYWQVSADKDAREKLAFFTPDGKLHFTVMPMGALNGAAVFVAMMAKMQKEWDELARSRGITHCASKVIIDDVLIHGREAEMLLRYFRAVVDTLKHYRASIKLRKCSWFHGSVEFVGIDVGADGNRPAQSKHEAFEKLPRPARWADLRMVIGMIGFYSRWMPLFELDIQPWRDILAQQPRPGETTVGQEEDRLTELWLEEHQALFEKLKQAVLDGPVLQRPDPSRPFVLKTDWSRLAMGACLLQAEDTPEARAAEQRMQEGGKCEFDTSVSGLRLRPIAFISRKTRTAMERSMHSYIGEAACIRWAVGKFRRYLYGGYFAVLCDCSGLKQFLEGESPVHHTINRWRAELLAYHFEIHHRPARMMYECDLLTRYNRKTQEWRDAQAQEEAAQKDQAATLPLQAQATVTVPPAAPRQSRWGPKRAEPSSDDEDWNAGWDRRKDQGERPVQRPPSAFSGPPVPVASTFVQTKDPAEPAELFSWQDMTGFPGVGEEPPTGTPVYAMQTLPQPEYVGGAPAAIGTGRDPLDPQRRVAVVGAIGAPIAEALATAGMTATDVIVGIEDEPATLLARQLTDEWPTDTIDSWLQAASGEERLPHVDWLVAIYHGPRTSHGQRDEALEQWARRVASLADAMAARCHLQAAACFAPTRWPAATFSVKGWASRKVTVRNSYHGGPIETDHAVTVAMPCEIVQHLTFEEQTAEFPGCLEDILDGDAAAGDALIMNDLVATKPPEPRAETPISAPLATPADNAVSGPLSAKVERFIKRRTAPSSDRGHPAYSRQSPGPSLERPDPGGFFGGLFGVWIGGEQVSRRCCRSIRDHEVWRAIGLAQRRTEVMLQANVDHTRTRARTTPGKHGLAALLTAMRQAEIRAAAEYDDPDRILAFVGEVNELTTVPLPTEERWREETANDPDLATIATALTTGEELDEVAIMEKRYLEPFGKGQLSLEDGVIYFYDVPKTARIRQMRVRVTPPKLRRVAIVACHASPMGGHSGVTRTYYRVAARFWWPTMKRDVDKLVRFCAHCRLGNATMHDAQDYLNALESDGPFDVVFMDFWEPGEIPDKSGMWKLLTMLDEMTSFAAATATGKTVNSEVAAHAAFQLFTAYGLPRLVIVDDGKTFAGVFKELFARLLIPVQAVGKGNHKAVRNEMFHRYLNKVEKINTANTGTQQQWLQGVFFALYGWNAGPVDGTDIPRSVVAIGREFPFPIDLALGHSERHGGSQGQQAADHFEAASPLLYRQRTLFDILVRERRERHRELRNQDRNPKAFAPGDIVIVRRDVKSSKEQQVAHKLVFKSKGPYRVLAPVHANQQRPSSYWVQRIPFCRGLGRAGRRVKAPTARMERLPSTLVLHKYADGADIRFASMQGAMRTNPLEKWLRVLRHGTYDRAGDDEVFAYERVADLWPDEDLDSDDSDDEAGGNQGDDGDSDDDGDGPGEWTPRQVTLTDRRALNKLMREVRSSEDRLFIIAFKPPGAAFETWYVVQVDLDRCSVTAMRDYGTYRCRWYVRHWDDARRYPIRECRFWPEIHKCDPDGTPGPIVPVKPFRVQRYLDTNPDHIWYQHDVCLSECRLAGPFDRAKMARPGSREQQDYRIPNAVWLQLREAATARDISTENLDQITPL